MTLRGSDAEETLDADVLLIGAGIMSATLASLIAVLQPDWRIVVLERAEEIAAESSAPWNNAGTGHAGYCELNYMPDPTDGRKAAEVARQFHVSRQWWAYLAESRLIDPAVFLHRTPHMDIAFGRDDVNYLRRRHQTLTSNPLFEGLELSDQAATIAKWAPLIMKGRQPDEPVAATLHPEGTDIDFGALTRELTHIAINRGGKLLLRHDVRRLHQKANGHWAVSGLNKESGRRFSVQSRYVFVGAGGMTLRLLQEAKLPEIRGYAVLPVGAAFYRCSKPSVVGRHNAKVYGKAALGAPPMSVPHFDRRVVGGKEYLLFGPYATFSTKLLKHGKLTDFFTTIRWRNVHVLAAAIFHNLPLIKYLIKELAASPRTKFAQLQRFYPEALADDWELVTAGQRAQVVAPHQQTIGELRQGTELITSADHSMSGLLGASPGASTAVPIMIDLLRQCFPDRWASGWQAILELVVPGCSLREWDSASVRQSIEATNRALNLSTAPNRRY